MQLTAPTGAGLSFQYESRYLRPTWPATSGDQQMMMHLDIRIDDLAAAEAHARACGVGTPTNLALTSVTGRS